MDKADIGIALATAALVVGVFQVVLAYFSVDGKRLIDLKIFAIWCSLLILLARVGEEIYLWTANSDPITLTRILTLNMTATAGVVLLLVGAVFKRYLRQAFEQKE